MAEVVQGRGAPGLSANRTLLPQLEPDVVLTEPQPRRRTVKRPQAEALVSPDLEVVQPTLCGGEGWEFFTGRESCGCVRGGASCGAGRGPRLRIGW